MARVSKAVQEINSLMTPSKEAAFVTGKYTQFRNRRTDWNDSAKELRNYLFQTDTSTTSNQALPWKNTTSVPKLAQLRDNLHANYMAALFPHDNWFKWEAATKDAATVDTVQRIEGYMVQKIRESDLKQVVSSLLYDYIDYGNSFAEVTYESESHTTDEGTVVPTYNGPRVHRISPYDIYFDLSAPSFKNAAKVTRSLVSLGSLKLAHQMDPTGFDWVPDALKATTELRQNVAMYGDSDIDKADGMQADGFGSLREYLSSDMVELLEYEGDLFNIETGEVSPNMSIIVMDRRTVVKSDTTSSWLGRTNKEHVGWRDRPDNLMSMGPLDNLVGMQYRLDHLENLKADVFDQIAHPVVYQRGVVEEWSWGPGERIFGDTDSEVRVLSPDTTALNADFQIDNLMRHMEELAGAPREAMGIRTPGEKTAFEVQSLENSAGRIFQQKIQKFEEELLEPVLNQMLEAARRNLNAVEVVKVLGDDFAVQQFLDIKPETLNQKGKLYPIGARHFAKQAQTVQNLNGFLNSAAYQDPAVATHISGLKIAQLMEENLGLTKFDLVEQDIRVAEQQQTQGVVNQAQENVVNELADKDIADSEAAFEEGL